MSQMRSRDINNSEKKGLILSPPLPTLDKSPPRSQTIPPTAHPNSLSRSPQSQPAINPLHSVQRIINKQIFQSRSDIKTSPWRQTESSDGRRRSLTPTTRQNNIEKENYNELKSTIIKMSLEIQAKDYNQQNMQIQFDNQIRAYLAKIDEQAYSFQEERKVMKFELLKNGEERRKLLLEFQMKIRSLEEENRSLKQNSINSHISDENQVNTLKNQVSLLEDKIIYLEQIHDPKEQPHQREQSSVDASQQLRIGSFEERERTKYLEAQIEQVQIEIEMIRAEISSSLAGTVKNTNADLFERISQVISPLFKHKISVNDQYSSSLNSGSRLGRDLTSRQEDEVKKLQQDLLAQKEEYENRERQLIQQIELLTKIQKEWNLSHHFSSNIQVQQFASKFMNSCIVEEITGENCLSEREEAQNVVHNKQFSEPNQEIVLENGKDLKESEVQLQLEIYLQQMKKNVDQLSRLEEIISELQESIKQKEYEGEEQKKLIYQLQEQLYKNNESTLPKKDDLKLIISALVTGESEKIDEALLNEVHQNQYIENEFLREKVKEIREIRDNLRRTQEEKEKLTQQFKIEKLSLEATVKEMELRVNNVLEVVKEQESIIKDTHIKLNEKPNQVQMQIQTQVHSQSKSEPFLRTKEQELNEILKQQETFLNQFKMQQEQEKENSNKTIASLNIQLRKAQQTITQLSQQKETLIPKSKESSLKNSCIESDSFLPESPKILTANYRSRREVTGNASLLEVNYNSQIDLKQRCLELESLLEGQNYAETLNEFAKKEITLKKELEELRAESNFWKQEHSQCQEEAHKLALDLENAKSILASISDPQGNREQIKFLTQENERLHKMKDQLLAQLGEANNNKKQNNSLSMHYATLSNYQNNSYFNDTQRNQQIKIDAPQGDSDEFIYNSGQKNSIASSLIRSEAGRQQSKSNLQDQIQVVNNRQFSKYSNDLVVNQKEETDKKIKQKEQEYQHLVTLHQEMKIKVKQLTSQNEELTKRVYTLSAQPHKLESPAEQLSKRMENLSEANEFLANENSHLLRKYRALKDKLSSLIQLATGMQELQCSCENCGNLKASLKAGMKDLRL